MDGLGLGLLLFFSNGGASPAWTVESALVGLAMVTFLSWVVRINVTYRWIRQHSHFCPLFKEWYVVYQHVRKVHPFMLRKILGLAVFGLSCFFFVFCARWGYWAWFFTSCGVQGLGLVGVPFIGRAPRAKVGWGITFMISGRKA